MFSIHDFHSGKRNGKNYLHKNFQNAPITHETNHIEENESRKEFVGIHRRILKT